MYGPAHHDISPDFILEMSEKLLLTDKPVLIGGDFNLIRWPREKNNDNLHVGLMDMFNSFIADMDLKNCTGWDLNILGLIGRWIQ